MKIKYEVTIEDLEEFSVYFMVNNKFGRRQYVLGRVLSGMLPFLLLFLVWGYDSQNGMMYLGSAVILSVLMVQAFSWLLKRNLKRLIRRMYAGDYAKGLLGWHERVLTDAGIEATTETAKSSTRWEGIKAVQFVEEHIYIFLGPNTAWVVPKKRISEGNYDSFKEELKRLFEKNRPGMKVESLA